MNKHYDKFAKEYLPEHRQQDLSQYVHENFKLIHTKMISEMRRYLDIEPDMSNKDGYVSLMVSLYGRMFNEMVYGMAACCQSMKMQLTDIVPPLTLMMLLDLIGGENPLKGGLRSDVENNREAFNNFYLKNVDTLREVIEALPR